VITDGQMSGLVNGGLVAAEVAPEAGGGPIGPVRDGDMISIDVNSAAINLEVDPAERDRRRADLPPLAAPAGCGWLSVYARIPGDRPPGATR
jgi:dihydroxy-acid dehydratase